MTVPPGTARAASPVRGFGMGPALRHAVAEPPMERPRASRAPYMGDSTPLRARTRRDWSRRWHKPVTDLAPRR